MFHGCVKKFDVMSVVEIFLKTKQDLGEFIPSKKDYGHRWESTELHRPDDAQPGQSIVDHSTRYVTKPNDTARWRTRPARPSVAGATTMAVNSYCRALIVKQLHKRKTDFTHASWHGFYPGPCLDNIVNFFSKKTNARMKRMCLVGEKVWVLVL